MDAGGYTWDANEFALLLLRKQYPERTQGESIVIRAFLLEHLLEFDRLTFSKRVGKGLTPDPTHPEAVQRNTVFSTQLRIDILGWRGRQPIIVEVKQRITPATLGQILTYRHWLLEEIPDALEPQLVAVGREAVDDAVVALQAHGVTVYLYPDATAGPGDAVVSQ
jgi:hypothetical protein